jgi:hypothetical protein
MMRKLFQTQCLPLLLLLVCTATLYAGCAGDKNGSPHGYNFKRGQKRELGKVLNEISGLAYNRDSSTLLAISDSKNKIFSIDLKKGKLSDYAEKFYAANEQPDYEDLVKLGDTVYVLVSNGTIVAVPKGARDTTGTRVYPFPSDKKNDFESLYFDSTVNSLILLCKNCVHEKGENFKTAFRFDLKTYSFDSTAFYTIDEKELKALVKNDDAKFRPSAAAIHPYNKRLYILASAGNLMVVTDTRGKVIEAYQLNPDYHPQAEGIAFAPDGTMYISNEGKYGVATLQIFSFRQTGQK